MGGDLVEACVGLYTAGTGRDRHRLSRASSFPAHPLEIFELAQWKHEGPISPGPPRRHYQRLQGLFLDVDPVI